VPWTVEVGDEFAPEFDQLHEEVRIEILALRDSCSNSGRS